MKDEEKKMLKTMTMNRIRRILCYKMSEKEKKRLENYIEKLEKKYLEGKWATLEFFSLKNIGM